jgi:hypothetical protein
MEGIRPQPKDELFPLSFSIDVFGWLPSKES